MDARSNPPSHQNFYAAFVAHDARFDGRVFVGVTSTGVYCRPVCRVRTPIARNCRFFVNAASAEHAGFRPCLRCRPELAPGLSLVDSSEVLAHHAARTIEQAAREGQALAMPQIAQRLGVTDRHLRRIFAQVHGVSPIAYLTTQRLLLAKQLLTDTAMPVTQVALASGFGSLRRFNAAFIQRYRLQPTGLRKQRDADDAPGTMPTLRLAWRPPYDVAGVLRFFADRQLTGVEHVSGLTFRRTLALQHQGERHSGWLAARWMTERNELELCLAPSLTPAVGVLLQAARQAFDLDADPQRIDPLLAGLPGPPAAGMRVPNGFDGWETAVRVVLGQQVTVAAARTLVQRLVQRFGEPIATPFAQLNRLFPTSAAIAQADPETIGTLGIVRQRVRALQALAAEVHAGRIILNRAAPLQATLAALRELPGIGEWTAQLVAMRALAWPDAFPASDIGVLNALHTRDTAEATRRAEAWRPWRAYAVIALWQTLIPPETLAIKEAA
jgi:AraC family transcriptional regulator, regulatory protein of adaptative response / DNA-3-methyladenine glycosylase II